MEFLKGKFKWILSLFLTVFLMASSFLGCTLEDLDSFLGNEETITAENQNETTTNNNMDHTNRNGIMLEYVITGNETLEQVLNKFDVDLEELLKYNGMNAIGLRRGTVLRIPKKIDD